MAIIPRYTSRALPEGAQPGLIDSARSRGRAGARLASAAGGAIIAGVEYKNRKDAARAAERAYRTRTLKDMKEAADGLGDSIEDFDPFGDLDSRPLPDGWTVGFGEATPTGDASAAARTGGGMAMRTGQQKQVRAALDRQSDETLLASLETAMTQARAAAQAAAAKPGTPAKDMARLALAQFDRDVAKLSKGIEDRPHLKSRFDALAVSSRAPMELRMLTVENARRAGEEKVVLSESLAGLAQAAAVDPAMAPGATGRGFAQIEAAMKAGMLDPQEAAAMQGAFAENLHMSAMRGQIAADPAQALEKLASGEFDTVFDEPARKRLTQEAETAARAKGAEAAAAARARRRVLELDMEEHLAALAETGAGDAALEARARAELTPEDYAVFEAKQAAARESYATRREYAFMTDAEIEADLEAYAPRDTDERDETRTIRREVADEVLAARADDPAGWAMRDESVKQAIEDAEAALEAAEPGTSEMSVAEREYRRALAARDALQRDMGIAQPRLLSEVEREEIAGELAQAAPAERLATISALRARYGRHYEALTRELSGRVSADTAVLLAHAGDLLLAGTLARGMALDGVEYRGARELTLPMIDDKLDKSRLEDGQLYSFMTGDRVVRVIYDRGVDALVPVLAEGQEMARSGQPGRVVSAVNGAAQEFVGQFADIPQGMAISEGAVYQGVLGVFNQIETGEKPDLSKISGWAKGMDLFRRYLQGDRAQRDALYAEVEGIARGVIGSDLYQAGQWIKDATREALPTNPEYEDEIQQKLARGGGSLAAFVAGGLAGRAVKIPATLITVTMGGYSNATAMFLDAIANGADLEEAYRAAQLGAGAGLTEAIPVTRLLGRIDRGAGGSIRRALIEAAKGGTEEALQEGFQAIVNNLIKSKAVGYDPERELFEGVGENAGISFTLGGLANFIAVVAGIRRRPAGPMDAPQHPTAPQRDGPGAETAPEDMGNAPSGKAKVEGDAEAGLAPAAELDISVAERVIDDKQIAEYAESSLHENFRESDRSYAEPGQAGQDAFGLIDPESDKPIIQPINNVEQMLAMAKENVEPLTQQLTEIVADIPGVEFSGARVKGPDRLAEKLATGRRADTLGDYLGGRIVVDDPAMLGEAVRVLTARYKNVEVDYFIKEPRETGYRAIHVQIVLDNGMTAEIQIMPSEILPVYEREHENYEKWRNKDEFTEEDIALYKAYVAAAQQAYGEAYKLWLQGARD